MRIAPRHSGYVLLAAYLGGWLVALVGLTGITVGLFAVDAAIQGGVSALGAGVPTWVLAVVFLVQMPAMVALVPVVYAVLPVAFGAGTLPARPAWSDVFGAHRAPWATYALALLAGLSVGLLPGAVLEAAAEVWPWVRSGTLQLVAGALQDGPLPWRVLFAVEVAFGAAIAEELVFRGFLWEAARRSGGPGFALVQTSLVFALYHLDPVQSVAVLPTGLLLGLVRWTSGSVWPCVLLHAANNGLAVVLAWGFADADLPLGVGVGAGAVAAGAAVALAVLRHRAPGGLLTDAPWQAR